MFEQFYKYCGFRFAKFQFRSTRETPVTMTRFLRDAKQILIALPAGYDDANVASNALRKLRTHFDRARLTVIHTGTRETSLTGILRCEVVRIDPTDVNRFFLPRQALLQRIGNASYDVAIDLNLDFVLHTAYICRAVCSGVRVGFLRPEAEPFFNVQVETDAHAAAQAKYDKLITTLAMF
jgi:ADP-heptose:LPS heptosyltransferase